jgi:hypothetical protein
MVMRCAQFENRIQNLLDERGRPEVDAMLRQHAGDCPDCRQRLAGYEALLEGVAARRRSNDVSRQGDVFASQVLQELRDTRPRPVRWRLAAAAIAASMAATLILRNPLAEVPKPVLPAKSVASGQDPGKDRLVPRVAHAIKPSTRFSNTADSREDIARDGLSLAAVVLRVPGGNAAAAAANRVSQFGPQPPWVDEVTSPLRPLASPMAEALKSLLKAMPRFEEDQGRAS